MAVIASVSGLNVAQTHLAVEFGASQDTVLWIINAYTLALAALLLPLGAIGDRVGRKPVPAAGLVVFAAAGVVAGLAPSAGVMVAARVAAGAAAATIMPITLAVITSTFPEEERGKAIGVWTGVAGGGGVLGMFLSALLVDVADWRWLFALPVALAVVALAMALKSVPDSRERPAHPFDTTGALVSAIAVTGLVFALQEGPERGWTAPVTLISLTAGVAAAIAVVLFPFLQAVLGWSGLLSTAAMMPMAVTMTTTSGLAPKVAAKIGARPTTTAGVASALNDVTRELGTALGVAVLGALLANGYRNAINGKLDGIPRRTPHHAGPTPRRPPSTGAATSPLADLAGAPCGRSATSWCGSGWSPITARPRGWCPAGALLSRLGVDAEVDAARVAAAHVEHLVRQRPHGARVQEHAGVAVHDHHVVDLGVRPDRQVEVAVARPVGPRDPQPALPTHPGGGGQFVDGLGGRGVDVEHRRSPPSFGVPVTVEARCPSRRSGASALHRKEIVRIVPVEP